MKKLLLASLLTCVSFGAFAFEPVTAGTTHPSGSVPDGLFGWLFKVNVKVTIVYGSGGIPCGPGEGICSKTIEGGASAGSGLPTAPGTYAAVTTDGVFCIYTPDATGNRHFEGSVFKQPKDSVVEGDITKALKMGPFTIKSGAYTIEHRGKEAVIVFPKR